MIDFETAKKYMRKKMRSDDGYVTKRRGILPLGSLEPKDERSEEIAMYQQIMEELRKGQIQPPMGQPMQYHEPRKLTINLEF